MRNSIYFLILIQFSSILCGRDFYKILEISRDASDQDIKKAFRKLSLQYHPDKNAGDENAAKKYIDINAAYEVLTDIEKKQIYDQRGEEGLNNQHDVDIFGNQKHKKGPSSQVDLQVSLEELYNGAVKSITIQRNVVCSRCKGTGSKDGKIKQCPHCRGQGKIMQTMSMGIGFNVQMQTPCNHCGGKGQMTVSNCPVCGGHKVVQGEKNVQLLIEKGMSDGHQIVFEKQGEQSPDFIPGDVVFVIKQKKHETFSRQGDDLFSDLSISLKESILGFKKQIKHLDSHYAQVESQNKIIQPFQVQTIKGEGMPHYQEASTKGDLNVKFIVNLPKVINDEARQILKQIFKSQK